MAGRMIEYKSSPGGNSPFVGAGLQADSIKDTLR